VLCTSDGRELQALFSGLDFSSLGMMFGDGTTAASINGSLIYRGATFLTDADRRRFKLSSRSDPIGRLHLLIGALRKTLSHDRPFPLLNNRDPVHSGANFDAID